MEALGVFIFLSVCLLCLTLISLKERKECKRLWDYRERLLESINNNSQQFQSLCYYLDNIDTKFGRFLCIKDFNEK